MKPQPLRRVLVTGASGFVGLPLCHRLTSFGVEVTGAGRNYAAGPWREFLVVDLGRDHVPASLLTGLDTVFHLAGKAHAEASSAAEAEEHWNTNFEGTRRILESARRAGVANFVYISSVKAIAAEGAYGQSKRRAEELVLDQADNTMHRVVLRPALMYGPRWKGNLHKMASSLQAGRFPPIPETGNRRSMIHVDDVVSAAITSAQCEIANRKIYVLTDGETYSTRRIYTAMSEALGKKVPPWAVPVPLLRLAASAGDALETVLKLKSPINSAAFAKLFESEEYDSTQIGAELGWRPKHTFDTALPEIVAAGESQPLARAADVTKT